MSIQPAHQLGPFIVNEYGDRYLYPVNRDTFKRIGSHTLYKRQFGEGFFREKTLHIIAGTDSGLLLSYLLKNGLPEGSRYLFVELPWILERLNAEGVLSNLDERTACVCEQDLQDGLARFQVSNYLYTERINIWKSFAGNDAFLPDYPDLYWRIRNTVDAIAWHTKVELGSQIFIQRQLENLADNRVSAACLKGVFTGKTAVLLAGGPSLDEILPWVRENRKNLVVLAVSRIARRLQQIGLVPDIFFSVDPHAVSFDVSREMLDFANKSIFINSYHVYPPLLSQWTGRSLYTGARFPWAENEGGIAFGAGPTVTNTAFAIAVTMGFSQIILAGVDLCFSQTGQSHAKGSNESLAGPQFNHFDTMVETNDGSRAFTHRAMAEAIPTFAMQAGCAQRSGCRTINPAAKAARIDNVFYHPLSEISFEPLHEPAFDILQSVLPADDPAARLRHYRALLEKLSMAQARITAIQKLANDGLKCNDGLFGRNGLKQDFKYKIRMDKIEKALARPSLAPYADLVKKYGLRQFVNIARPDTDLEWSDEQIEATGRIYYEAFRDGARELQSLLKNASQRVELRIAEENPQTDAGVLARSWRQFGEPGRVKLWKKRQGFAMNHSLTSACPEIEKLEEEFKTLMHCQDSGHLQRSYRDADPSVARSKARILFKNKDRDSLSGLAEGLAVMKQKEALPVLHLVRGYLAELCENPAAAFDAYHQVIETDSAMAREDALTRIAALSLDLGDGQNALLALQCLSAMTPIYLAQYADLAKLMGQTQTALNAYADYLETAPGDPVVLLKVGKLYKEIEQRESATAVFEYLLANDPENRDARLLLNELVT